MHCRFLDYILLFCAIEKVPIFLAYAVRVLSEIKLELLLRRLARLSVALQLPGTFFLVSILYLIKNWLDLT